MTRFPLLAAALSIVALDALLGAQAPATTAAASSGELPLLRLDALARQGVHALQSLQSPTRDGPPAPQGSAHAFHLANVRDARFDHEGQLLHFLVEQAGPNARSDREPRLLPARAVRWDTTRRLWLVVEPNLQFAELAAASSPVAAESTPGTVTRRGSMASELVVACAEVAPTAVQPGRPAIVIWMAPTLQRLVVAAVPIPPAEGAAAASRRFVAVPWSRVAVVEPGHECSLRLLPTATELAAGPDAGDGPDGPDAAVRHRAYSHFLVTPPAWDPLPAAAEPAVARKR